MTRGLYTTVQGAGPDVVLLHGWGLHGGVWEEVAAQLATAHRVTCIDLPGHGRSAFDGRDDIGAFVEQLRAAAPPRAAWIGWSLGGLLALQLALAAPAAAERLIVVAGTPRFVRAPDWECALDATVLEQFARELDADFEATLLRFLALQTRGAEAAGATLRMLRTRLLEHGRPHPAALRAGLALLRDSDLRAGLGAIACPTTFVLGGRDVLVPPALVDALGGLLPGVRSTVLAKAGHAPFVSHPQEFLAVIRGALHD